MSEKQNEGVAKQACEKVSITDLEDFVNLGYSISNGIEDVKDFTDEFIAKGYGNSLSEVEAYFRQHFGECGFCSKEAERKMRVMQMLMRVKE